MTRFVLRPAFCLPATIIMVSCGNAPEEPPGTAMSYVLAAGSDTAIVLPIEVFGSSGTHEEISFNLQGTSNIDHLYLRCQACGYHVHSLDIDEDLVKAQVRVNDCDPTDLKAYIGPEEDPRDTTTVFHGNPAVTVIGPEAEAGGLGGAFRVARMSVAVDNSCFQSGVNTLTFIHKNAMPHSLGFRIIDVNLLRNGDLNSRVLPRSSFVDDDPSLWLPILTSAADIEAGRSLWRKRDHLYDLGADLSDGQGDGQGPNDGVIKAACADCHLPSGRDLAYFNFSSFAIVKGAMSHKLSERQGQQIASFIQNLKTSGQVPTVRRARPWNPPYQPGPGLDSRPVRAWAAGAGLDWILESDEDTLQYLFPNGTTNEDVKEVVDRYGMLNMRELPVNLAMPHWGAWLPPVSPIDAFDLENDAILSDENGQYVGRPFFEVLYTRARGNPTRENLSDLFVRASKWWGRNATCFTQSVFGGPAYRGINGAVTDAITLPHRRVTKANCIERRHDLEYVKGIELARRSLANWIVVRLWEIVHSNALEWQAARQTAQWCSRGRCVAGAEPRGWVTAMNNDEFDVYHLAPHYLGFNSKYFSEKSRPVAIYEGNQWYHLQMILNPGYREFQTSHWAYTLVFLNNMAQIDIPAAARYYASIIKMRQCQTNGFYGGSTGLTLRTAQPFWYFSGENGERIGQQSLPNNLYRRIYNALAWDFLRAVGGAKQEDWENAKANNMVQPRNSTDFSLSPLTRQVFPHPAAVQGRNTYRLIDITSQGVEMIPRPPLNLQRAMCDWGEEMWPKGPWRRLRSTIESRYGN